MDILLTSIEARVLGSLIEKEIITPDYYPLTLNSLTAACNQKSNRTPTMNLDEKSIVRALDSLRQKHLAWQKSSAESRVPKYAHGLLDLLTLSPQELSLLCVLLLRGAQTPGELHTRTARLCEFEDLQQVEATLQGLMEREDGPFITKLPRLPGHRECRYAHLFCGEVKVDEEDLLPAPEAATLLVRAEDERISRLEEEIVDLRNELKELRKLFDTFTRQFE